MGSGRWNQGLWGGSDSPHCLRLVQLCGSGPSYPGNPHERLHCECDKTERDRDTGNAFSQCLCSLSSGSLMSYCHTRKWQCHYQSTWSHKYDKVVTTNGSKMIDTILSKIIHVWMKTAFIGVRLNVMTHALHASEGLLSLGLMIQNTYTEMHNGSKNLAIVVRISTAYSETLKKIRGARMVAANWVSELQAQPGMIDMLDKAQGIQTPKLTAEQRQEKLFKKLNLSSLESWLPELGDSTCLLLAEYHGIFSLEPCELGCTHSTKHVIKVTNDVTFKEQFMWIPLPLAEEVHSYL